MKITISYVSMLLLIIAMSFAFPTLPKPDFGSGTDNGTDTNSFVLNESLKVNESEQEPVVQIEENSTQQDTQEEVPLEDLTNDDELTADLKGEADNRFNYLIIVIPIVVLLILIIFIFILRKKKPAKDDAKIQQYFKEQLANGYDKEYLIDFLSKQGYKKEDILNAIKDMK